MRRNNDIAPVPARDKRSQSQDQDRSRRVAVALPKGRRQRAEVEVEVAVEENFLAKKEANVLVLALVVVVVAPQERTGTRAGGRAKKTKANESMVLPSTLVRTQPIPAPILDREEEPTFPSESIPNEILFALGARDPLTIVEVPVLTTTILLKPMNTTGMINVFKATISVSETEFVVFFRTLTLIWFFFLFSRSTWTDIARRTLGRPKGNGKV